MDRESKTAAISVYLYELADENRGVIGGLHEHHPRYNFTVVESLGTQSSFSQATCID